MEDARTLSGGNFSRFINSLLEERVHEMRRAQLREDLRRGYEAERNLDIEIAEEYRCVDSETALRTEF